MFLSPHPDLGWHFKCVFIFSQIGFPKLIKYGTNVHYKLLCLNLDGSEKGGGFLTDHRENKPPQVSVDGQVDHFLNRVKVWIVQVPQKPQYTRTKHLQTNNHCKVEDNENNKSFSMTVPVLLSPLWAAGWRRQSRRRRPSQPASGGTWWYQGPSQNSAPCLLESHQTSPAMRKAVAPQSVLPINLIYSIWEMLLKCCGNCFLT